MRIIWLGLAALFAAVTAHADSLGTPQIATNDTWTYQRTTEDESGWHQTRIETAVLRSGVTSIALSEKPVGSTMPPVERLTGADWSRFRSVNGRETVVNRPLSFPLSVGKTSQVECDG